MSKHTDREKLQALLDGKKLINKGSLATKATLELRLASLVKFGLSTPYSLETSPTINLANWEIYEEPKWYDNIPEQGILCRVWDTPIEALVKIVVRCCKGEEYPYYCQDGEWYANAEPVQLADLEPYILKG